MVATFNFFLRDLLNNPLTLLTVVPVVLCALLGLAFLLFAPRQFLLILKNLRRNPVRTGLTVAATMVLVVMATLIWTIVFFLDLATQERSRDFKLIVTEKWQLPSQLPLTHARYLDPSSPDFILDKNDVGPNDFMTWSFFGGTLDAAKRTRDNMLFFFVMNPDHIKTMMEDLQELPDSLIAKMKEKKDACLVGRERLATLKKRVGDRIKVTSFNYKDVDLQFDIIGELPDGQNSNSAIMNADYFNNALDKYKQDRGGKAHPLDEKRLNLIWLRVKDKETFARVQHTIESSSVFANRPVKCETASSGVAAFLDAYRDMLWGMKWLLVPAILISMALVVANAISISVRERRTEMAVLKVLGFRPNQILRLVLGESLLVGGLSGLLAGTLTYVLINVLVGGIAFPIAFFPRFLVPFHAFFWGASIGLLSGFVGSFLPAWSARSVKVSEVFSKVA
jgi:putative ABC transport system permease protein